MPFGDRVTCQSYLLRLRKRIGESNVSMKQPSLWNDRKKLLALTAGAVALSLFTACRAGENPVAVFKESGEPFVYNSLAASPVTATALGYHEHTEGGRPDRNDDSS